MQFIKHMSRKTIVVLTMILFSTCIFAKTHKSDKGYRGDVSLGDMFGLCNYSSYQNSDDCYWQGRVGEKVRSLTLGVGLRFGKMEKHK